MQSESNRQQGRYSQSQGGMASRSKKKKRSKGWLVFLLIVFLLALAGGGAYWYYLQSEERMASEEQEYAALQESYNSEDYEIFLRNYPDSPHKAEVMRRMNELKATEADWKQIEGSSNPDDFAAFKNRHNHPIYDRLCDAKIDSLDWISAQEEDTEEAYRRYMQLHIDGQYYSEASFAVESATRLASTAADSSLMANTVREFFSAFADNDTEELSSLLPGVMKQFLNKTRVEKNDVLKSIAGMFNEHILDCNFAVDDHFDISSKEENGRKIYTLSTIVEQNITRDNSGKTHGKYRVTAEMDNNYKILSLTMKDIGAK